MYLVKDRGFYKNLLAIALPIAMQNTLNLSVSLISTLMLGLLGSLQIAASSLANQPMFIFNLMTIGLAGGASVLTAQYWGRKDRQRIRIITALVLKYAVLASMLFALILGAFPTAIMKAFSNDPEVIVEGAKYLRITALAYPFLGMTNTSLAILRSVEKVWVSFWITLVTLGSTIFFNRILIFGSGSFAAMGILGSAWAQVISRILGFVFVIIYIFFFEKNIQLRPRSFLLHEDQLRIDVFKNATPVVINEFLWGFGASAQAMVLGHMGKIATTAHSISSSLLQLSMVFIYGITSAGGVIIGKTLGAEDYDKIRPYIDTLKTLSMIIGVGIAFFILLVKTPFINLYNIDLDTKFATDAFMKVTAAIAMLQCLYSPLSLGVLRAGGDTKYVLFLDVFFLWTFGLPLGLAATKIWGLPPHLVYLCLKADEPIKVFLTRWRIRGTSWMRNLTIKEE